MAKSRGRPKKGKGSHGPYLLEVEDSDLLGGGGIRLRQHRLARGWTMEKLAEAAGVSTGTIAAIENGKGYSPDMLQKLAGALKVTVGELFDIDPRPGKENSIWPIWSRATPHQKQRILDYAKGVVGEA